MIHVIKIFYLVDIDTFKGTCLNESLESKYCFINSNNKKIITNKLDNFINENHPAFLGFYEDTNIDLKNAFNFKTFSNLNDAIKQFGIEWHQKTAHLIANTIYELTDSNKGLKITAFFNNNVDWDNFCDICQNQSISHGFEQQVYGSFYDRSTSVIKKGAISLPPF